MAILPAMSTASASRKAPRSAGGSVEQLRPTQAAPPTKRSHMRRRNRQRETRVWHNPLIKDGNGAADGSENPKTSFENNEPSKPKPIDALVGKAARIIAKPTSSADPENSNDNAWWTDCLPPRAERHHRSGIGSPTRRLYSSQRTEHLASTSRAPKKDSPCHRGLGSPPRGGRACSDKFSARGCDASPNTRKKRRHKAAVELRRHLGDQWFQLNRAGRMIATGNRFRQLLRELFVEAQTNNASSAISARGAETAPFASAAWGSCVATTASTASSSSIARIAAIQRTWWAAPTATSQRTVRNRLTWSVAVTAAGVNTASDASDWSEHPFTY